MESRLQLSQSYEPIFPSRNIRWIGPFNPSNFFAVRLIQFFCPCQSKFAVQRNLVKGVNNSNQTGRHLNNMQYQHKYINFDVYVVYKTIFAFPITHSNQVNPLLTGQKEPCQNVGSIKAKWATRRQFKSPYLVKVVAGKGMSSRARFKSGFTGCVRCPWAAHARIRAWHY